VPSAVVVVLLPVGDHDAGLGQAPEDVDVQALVADAGVERLDVAVAPRLAGRDEVQADSFAGTVGHRGARELGAVVAAQHGRVATHGRDAVEFVDEVVAGDGALDESAEAFAGVFVDDRCDLDRAAVSRGVEPEVDGPDRVRGVGDRCPVSAIMSAGTWESTRSRDAGAFPCLTHLVDSEDQEAEGAVVVRQGCRACGGCQGRPLGSGSLACPLLGRVAASKVRSVLTFLVVPRFDAGLRGR